MPRFLDGQGVIDMRQLGQRRGLMIIQPRRSSAWTPASLFTDGEAGAWYDPSDLSTLFTDSSGTIQVTSDGDPVGKMLDKSGNGNHATQSVSASRPTYKTDGSLHWLAFDGVDDYMATADFGFEQPESFICSFQRPIGESNSFILDGLDVNFGSHVIIADTTKMRLMASANHSFTGTIGDDGKSLIISTLLSGASSAIFKNGVSVGSGYAGLSDMAGVTIGAAATGLLPIEAVFFGIVAVGIALDDTDREFAEVYLATKAGVTL